MSNQEIVLHINTDSETEYCMFFKNI